MTFGLKAKERNHHRQILPVGKRFCKCEPQGEGKGKREKGGRKSQKSQKSQSLTWNSVFYISYYISMYYLFYYIYYRLYETLRL